MPLWPIVVFIGTFGLVLGALALGFKVVEDIRRRQLSNMFKAVREEQPDEPGTPILRQVETDRMVEYFHSLPLASRWERLLHQAGMTWTVPQLALAVVGGALVGALIGTKVRILLNPVPSAIAVALLCGLAPLLIVLRKRAARLKEFESQFPDALDFLARSMRAGHAFSVSLEMLAEEMADPLAYEFRQVFNEQNLGMSVDAALKNLHARVDLVDVGFFVSAVMLQKETGGNLAEILTKLAYIIRERFRLKMKVKTASAHGRLTGAILSFMPVALLAGLTVVVPEYIPTMVNDPVGRYLVIAAIIGQVIGYLCIRKIVRIKV